MRSLTRTLLNEASTTTTFGDCIVAVNSSVFGVERTPSKRDQV